jgi:sodium/proline symporter
VIGIAAAGDTTTLEPTPGQWIIASSGTPLTGLAIASLLGWGLGYFGQPHVLARFMATRNALEITAARRIALVWTLLGLVGAIAVGLSAGWILGPTAGDGDHEKVFILLAQTLLHPLVAGVLLAAILAAIMSTADSQLLVTSSALAEDLYRPLSGGQGGERRLLTISRIAVLGLALLAYWLASDPSNGVLELVSYAWAGFGAAFGPVVLAALHWDRTSGWGALAGILVGGLVVLAWRQLDGGVFELYELLPAFVLSTLALIGVSLLGPAPPGEVLDRHRDLMSRPGASDRSPGG